MEMDILLEIYFTEDRTKLLIVDYDQHEFYGIDVHYKRILSGKLSKTYADISSYIQDGEKYDFIYDKKGELSEIKTFSGDVVSYIENLIICVMLLIESLMQRLVMVLLYLTRIMYYMSPGTEILKRVNKI